MSSGMAMKRCQHMVLGTNATHINQICKPKITKTPLKSYKTANAALLNKNVPPRLRWGLNARSAGQSLQALRTNRITRTMKCNSVLAAAYSPQAYGLTAARAATSAGRQQTRAFAAVPQPSEQEQPPAASILGDTRVSFIGAGKMAEAIMSGVLRSGRVTSDRVMACDPNQSRRSELKDKYEVAVTNDNAAALEGADIVMLAVKPQTMSRLFQQLQGKVNKNTLIISVVAGYTIDQIQRGLGTDAVIRAMPNTPALIQESVTCWTVSPTVTQAQRLQARELLKTFGKEIYLAEEEKMDMATALAGSGPAMCHLMLEAMIDTGVHMGVPRETARDMVLNTMRGAVNLTLQSGGAHPSTLRNDITSPGGTTAAALYEIERGGLRTVMSDAIWAAYRRSRELGGLDSCVGPGRFHYNASLELPEELVENLQQVTESMNDIKDELADQVATHRE